MIRTSFETPAGLSKHTWVDRPDTKYNADGLFKTKLVCDLSVPAVAAYKAKIDAAAEAALAEETKDLSVGQRKKWEVYLPYTLEEDDETGEPPCRIIFEFKRSAKVTIRNTGQVKELSVAVYDSGNRLVVPVPAIPAGSLIRVAGAFRPIKFASDNRAGVRMDFSAVKFLTMAEELPMPAPFSSDEVAGGWLCKNT